ncbi:MAG: FAD-dependent oxidoreductase [Planctomycetota bacterium]
MSVPNPVSALVVGAGVSGAVAARTLAAAGWRVTVMEQNATRVGGRVCSVRVGTGLADVGAQQITAREEWFADLMHDATAAGVARVWTQQMRTAAGEPIGPAGPRWCGSEARGMQGIVEWCLDAPRIEVRCGATATSMLRDAGRQWCINESADALRADAVILALPADRSLALLGAMADAPLRARAAGLRYEPTIAVALELDQPAALLLPPDARVVTNHDVLAFVACRRATSLVLLATSAWSHAQLAASDDHIVRELQHAAASYVAGARVVAQHVQRWTSGIAHVPPPTDDQQPFIVVAADYPPLLLAGAWLADDRVEAAARSGRMAAQHLLECMA